MVDLLITNDQQTGIATDRALDANILVMIILKFPMQVKRQAEEEKKKTFMDILSKTVIPGTDWRTRWKSIYLATGIAFLLSKMYPQREVPQFLIKLAEQTFEQVKLEPVPSGWDREKKVLNLCQLESKVKSLASTQGGTDGVYHSRSSRETVPCLALYGPPHHEPTSSAMYRAVEKLQLQQ